MSPVSDSPTASRGGNAHPYQKNYPRFLHDRVPTLRRINHTKPPPPASEAPDAQSSKQTPTPATLSGPLFHAVSKAKLSVIPPPTAPCSAAGTEQDDCVA